MWSSIYWYFELRESASYLQSIPTDTVRNILMETGVLDEENKQSFRSKEGIPWMRVLTINSEKGLYGASHHFNSKEVNMIDIVASKEQPENELFYKTMLTSIAEKLNWQLIADGESEDGDELVLREASIR